MCSWQVFPSYWLENSNLVISGTFLLDLSPSHKNFQRTVGATGATKVFEEAEHDNHDPQLQIILSV